MSKVSTLRLIFILSIITLTVGCQTAKLWQGDEKNEYVKVIPKEKDDDVEVALKDLGKEYYCKELLYSEYPNNKICYVKRSEIEGLKIKLLKTPETLVIDATVPILIIGYIALPSLTNSGPRAGN